MSDFAPLGVYIGCVVICMDHVDWRMMSLLRVVNCIRALQAFGYSNAYTVKRCVVDELFFF